MDITARTAIAALADSGQAVKNWNELTTEIQFEYLPHLVIRAMPQIYINVKYQPAANHLQLLKGVYRSSWSNNAMRFAAARELFIALNNERVDYRVIKGGALCALAGNWAIRRMGDIDVVVSPEDEGRAAAILRRLNYLPRVDQDTLIDGPWDNEQGALIDLHVTRGKPALFTNLFSQSGVSLTLTNTQVFVPTPEYIFALAIWHANKQTAGTDHIQTLIDIGTLTDKIDIGQTRAILIKSGLLGLAVEFLIELSNLNLISEETVTRFSRKRVSDIPIGMTAKARKVNNIALRLSTFPDVVKRRKLTYEQKMELKKFTSVRSVAYRTWATLGQLAPVEKVVCARLGGFSDSTWQGGPIPERDFRLRIPAIKGEGARLKIHVKFDETSGLRPYRSLFINGKIQGFIPLPEDAPGTYELTPETDFIEISLRSFSTTLHAPIRVCEVEWMDSGGPYLE